MARTPCGRWARKASPVLSSFQSSQPSALSTSYLVHAFLLCMGPGLSWTPPCFPAAPVPGCAPSNPLILSHFLPLPHFCPSGQIAAICILEKSLAKGPQHPKQTCISQCLFLVFPYFPVKTLLGAAPSSHEPLVPVPVGCERLLVLSLQRLLHCVQAMLFPALVSLAGSSGAFHS